VRRWLPLSSGFVHAHVVRSTYDGFVVSTEPLENVGAFTMPAHRRVWSLAPLVSRLPEGAGRRPLSLALAALAAGRNVGLVHAHLGYGVADVVGFAQRRGLPLVLSLHGHDATSNGAGSRYDDVVDAVDAVIVPSDFLAAVAVDIGFDAARIHVIPSGVDTATFSATPLPDGPKEALFVGRFVHKKGIDVLLDAWHEVQRAIPDATLRLIGDGPLEHLVDADIPGVVHDRPDPARRVEQVRDAMRRATVVVQPSRMAEDGDAESLLLVNLEAQASGRPVVSTHHGGIPEFVDDGVTGVLVAEGDAAALADAVTGVLLDDGWAGALGAAGPAWAARFDVRACTAAVDALYGRLLAARGAK
jgi:glycosyltransferase involved in cell wall biosynthesis